MCYDWYGNDIDGKGIQQKEALQNIWDSGFMCRGQLVALLTSEKV